ncbi:MAG TPA: glycosyltransferase family 4 protein [Anaerolineales bacterium]|jgi:glycosyltransferase involved in cell wall biosynthesis|nr:glycosyltransferase family 4 protein [Anaerolineales bacterium]HQX17004.1 glycosyltransferase family 4 protein [Anaerolineales bacterium]
MKILFVADARSPIALNWIRYFAERGDEIYIASTFAASLDFPIKRMETIPVAFSGLKKATQRPGAASARTLSLRTHLRQWLGPLTIRRAAKQLREFFNEAQPDLIHAMRIPYEGMIAAHAIVGRVVPHDLRGAYRGHRLIVSTWGNDFTLHAPSSPLMKYYTRQTLQRADAIHSDCHRDIRLANEWGFDSSKPTLVAPGNGGIRADIFYPPAKPAEEPIILNPRGFRPYVRNDMFFKAIPLVLAKHANARFICTGMAGEEEAIRWIRELNIGQAVELLNLLPQRQIADLYRRAQVLVSPSVHDGTPNTLLEGMACGCFPVAGDLESIREWITPNENGLLFDSNDPQSIASALIDAIESKDLREKSAVLNREIISARAEYGNNLRRAEHFYKRVIGN